MGKWIRLFHIFVGFLFIFSIAAAAELSDGQVTAIQKRQLADLETILIEIDTHNGLVDYKERTLGITLDDTRTKYSRLILEAKTKAEDEGSQPRQPRQVLSREEFQQLLIGLAAEYEDGHFNILRTMRSANSWTLGIYTADIEGRCYVTGFDKERYFVSGTTRHDLKVGDEIIEIDGVPTEKVVQTILPSISMATHNSRLVYAHKMLLNRPHMWLPGVKAGDEVKIKFRRENSAAKKEGDSAPKAQIEFEGIFHWVNRNDYNQRARFFPHPLPEQDPRDEDYIFGISYLKTYFSEGLQKIPSIKGSFIDIGAILNAEIVKAKEESKKKDIVLSEDLMKVKGLKEMKDLRAYTYRYKGKTFGVIRLPDYGFYIDGVRWLREIVSRMDKLVDTLVIDQLDNGGGYVFSFTQFLRLFAHEKDFKLETINLRLSETLLSSLEAWSREADPKRMKTHFRSDDDDEKDKKDEEDDLFPKSNFARLILSENHLRDLRAKYERGEKWSGPLPYFSSVPRYKEGAAGIVVADENYLFKKPVLVLNDGRSGSGGDFFPSAMQVNKAALVHGSTSMGLGAPVYFGTDRITSVEMSMRCPFGECERPDGLSIEGLGTLPDLVRNPTIRDLHDGFKDYATDVADTALLLARGSSPDEVKKAREKSRIKMTPKTKKFLEVRTILEGLQAKIGAIAKVEEIIPAYQEAFSKLTLVDKSALSEADWAFLPIPLPEFLLKNDLFLSSLRRSDEMSDRLKKLPRLKFFKEHSEWIPAADFLSKNLGPFSRARKDVCYDHLAHFTKPH